MMFLRHGMFARKSIVERRRKLVIGGVLGLLLVLSMVIYAIVKAAGSYNLGYVDASNKGLTNGHISGQITKTDNSQASNVDRDGTVKLNLEFNFTNDMVESAKSADAWVYDLSSVVANNSFIAAVDSTSSPIDIVNDGVVIATYTVANGQVTVEPSQTTDAQNWWNDHTSNVKVGLSVNLELDAEGVGLNNSNSFVLPGTTTPEQASGVSTNSMYYDTPHVSINEAVFDEKSQNFKTGNYDQLVTVAKENSNYIATYNTNFYTDAYASDLSVTIALDGNQTFVSGGTFEMTTCTSNNCIHDPSKTTVSIPSNYITVSNDNKTATIDMEGFLHDHCGSGTACAAAGINGYTLNDPMQANNANGSDYYIQYKADLGQTNPAGSGQSYGATATISGNNGALTASSTVKYIQGMTGSKNGTCVNGSTTTDGVTTCNDDGNGNIYIDYVVTVGDASTDLSNTTIIDRITDNQIIVSDITLADSSNNTTTISLNNDVCSATNTGNDCIDPAAIDTTYSSNSQRLFEHAFTSGDTGPWTISYRVKIATDAGISGDRVDNMIDLKIGQSTFSNVWQTSTHYDFAPTMSIEKKKDYTHENDGYVHWTIRVYGPATGSAQTNVEVKDIFWYDANQYSTGTINVSVDSATVTVNDATTATSNYSTSTDANGNLVITIPTLGVGEVYSFGIETAADSAFKTAYAGKTIALTNQACRVAENRCTEQVNATILSPDAEVITKTAQSNSSVFYWKMDQSNNKYGYGTRKGYTWEARINPDAGVVTDANRGDYAPYFSDVIPQGLYLTNQYGQGSLPEPVCQTAGACDASVDIDQSKYSTTINVTRIIPSVAVGQQVTVSDVPVTVNSDGRIQPINLADLFNDSSCVISDDMVPSSTCAGINNATYVINYATAIADEVYNDILSEHSFSNQAKLYEQVDATTLAERDNAVETVTYRNDSIITKSDATGENLDSTNKIAYVITVNETAYAYRNNGEPYAQDATRPMLTITDVISDDVNLTGSITCTDINDVTVNDCQFNYDSETRTLTAEIPDGYARKIHYEVVVANPIPNNRSDYSNTAVLEVNDAEFESTTTKAHIVNGQSGYIIGNGTMKIKKVNAANINEAVPGATFKLVQVAYDSQGSLGAETIIDLNGAAEGTDGTTNNSGIIEFSDLCGYSTSAKPSPCENGGQLYYWQEVSAPAPYVPLGGTTKHYFMLYDEELLASGTEANRAVARHEADIIEENGNNTGIEIEVLKSNYEWIVSNAKQTETTLAIEKKVSGNTARVEDSFTITIQATDLAGQPLNGSLTSYTYLQSDREYLSYGDPVVFTNGMATITLDHGRGLLIDGFYVGGEYTITESNATGYTVSYICTDRDLDGGCDSDTSNTGTFVEDANTEQYPTVAKAGQMVILDNNSSTEITGISNKKPSLAIAIVFGSTVSILGIVIARRFRH